VRAAHRQAHCPGRQKRAGLGQQLARLWSRASPGAATGTHHDQLRPVKERPPGARSVPATPSSGSQFTTIGAAGLSEGAGALRHQEARCGDDRGGRCACHPRCGLFPGPGRLWQLPRRDGSVGQLGEPSYFRRHAHALPHTHGGHFRRHSHALPRALASCHFHRGKTPPLSGLPGLTAEDHRAARPATWALPATREGLASSTAGPPWSASPRRAKPAPRSAGSP